MPAPRHPLRSSPARVQRGVAAITFAVALVALVTTVMLGLNVGQLYYAQRDLERQAALGALAGAQIASGCRANGVPGSLSAVSAGVTDSLGVNLANGGTAPAAAVELGRIDRASTTSQYNVFAPLAAGSTGIDSVRATLTRAQPTVLAAALFAPDAGGRALTATAVGTQLNTARFSVGTALLTLDTNQSALLSPLLQSLLGASASVSVVSYQGLAQANVSLKNLMLAAGVNDLSDLLSLSTSLRNGLGILSTALSLGSDSSSAAAAALVSTLAGQAYSSGTVNFGDVIGSSLGSAFNPVVGDAVSAVPFIDGASLLTALAQDAAKRSGSDYRIALPVSLNIPQVTGEYVFLRVIQPQQIAVGPVGTTAKSAQLKLEVRLVLKDPSNLLGLLGVSVVSANVALDVDLASGSGTLTQVQCPNAANANPSATIAVSSNLAQLTLGAWNGSVPGGTQVTALAAPTGGTLITALSLLGINLLTVGVSHAVTVTAGSAINSTAGPFASFNAPTSSTPPQDPARIYTPTSGTGSFSTGSAQLLSSSTSSLVSALTSGGNTFSLLGLLNLGNVASLLKGPLALTASLLDTVVDDLLQLLGIQLGVVKVNLDSVTIGSPVITTFCSPTKPCTGVPS